jgi:hypothetical protein
LTGSSKSASIIAPFDGNNRFFMSISDMLIQFAIFIDEFETSICKSYGTELTGALTIWYPIMIDCIGVKFHPFSSLTGIGVPFIDDIIISDTKL